MSSNVLPKILIVLRAGRSSIHRSWINAAKGYMDVAISTYDDADFSADPVAYHHHIPGGKFEGVHDFYQNNPGLIDAYDYHWLVEDDLVLPHRTIVRVRELLARFRFPLSAPALSYDSFFSWPITVSNDRMLFRGTEFVEIMAPLMSGDFLRDALPEMGQTYSGWGLEWLWAKLAEDRNSFAAIWDDAPIVHTRPLGGNLYGSPRVTQVSPMQEMDNLMARYDLDRDRTFRNIFGVTRGPAPRVLTGRTLNQELLAGYGALMSHNPDGLEKTVRYLVSSEMEREEDELRALAGFDRVLHYLSHPYRHGEIGPGGDATDA